MQIEVIRVKGHWIAGGNIAFPFLMAMLLWWCPKVIKEMKGRKYEQFKKNQKSSKKGKDKTC